MKQFQVALESMKAIPQYTKEHWPEIAVYAVVNTTVTLVALKCFDKTKAASVFGIVTVAFFYRDRIYLFYQTFLNTQILALSVAAFAIPFLSMSLAIPTAAALSLGILKYEAGQIGTIRTLERLNATLTQNKEELSKRLKACDDIASSIETTIENQVGSNEKLATLYSTIKKNTGKLEKIADQENGVATRLNVMLKNMCILLNHIEKEGLIEDVIEASNLAKKIEEGQAKLLSLEKTVSDTTHQMNQTNSHLSQTTARLTAVVTALEKKQQPSNREDFI